MKTSGKGMKLLKVLHIITASVWFGTVTCIFGIALKCFFGSSIEEFVLIAPMIPTLYQTIVMPFAILTLLQGLYYGFFTKWGLIKHRWVVMKWLCVPIIGALTGIGSIARMQAAITRAENGLFLGGITNNFVPLTCITLQLIVLTVMMIIAVYKPSLGKPKPRNEI